LRRHQFSDAGALWIKQNRKIVTIQRKRDVALMLACFRYSFIFAIADETWDTCTHFRSTCKWIERNRLSPAKRSENPSLIAFWYGLLADSAPRKWVSLGRPTVSYRKLFYFPPFFFLPWQSRVQGRFKNGHGVTVKFNTHGGAKMSKSINEILLKLSWVFSSAIIWKSVGTYEYKWS